MIVATIAVVVPAACMGRTLPVLAQFVAARGHALGVRAGGLYAVNTLGAACAALVFRSCCFGVRRQRSVWLVAATSVGIGLVALVLPQPSTPVARRPRRAARRSGRRRPRRAARPEGWALSLRILTWRSKRSRRSVLARARELCLLLCDGDRGVSSPASAWRGRIACAVGRQRPRARSIVALAGPGPACGSSAALAFRAASPVSITSPAARCSRMKPNSPHLLRRQLLAPSLLLGPRDAGAPARGGRSGAVRRRRRSRGGDRGEHHGLDRRSSLRAVRARACDGPVERHWYSSAPRPSHSGPTRRLEIDGRSEEATYVAAALAPRSSSSRRTARCRA
jgi:hypothetical protein